MDEEPGGLQSMGSQSQTRPSETVRMHVLEIPVLVFKFTNKEWVFKPQAPVFDPSINRTLACNPLSLCGPRCGV